jgi:hypothetical protein
MAMIACNNNSGRSRQNSNALSGQDGTMANSNARSSGDDICVSPCEISVRMGKMPGFEGPSGSDETKIKLRPSEEQSLKRALASMPRDHDPNAHIHAELTDGELAFRPELVRNSTTNAHVTGNEPQITIRSGAGAPQTTRVVPSAVALAELRNRTERSGNEH